MDAHIFAKVFDEPDADELANYRDYRDYRGNR
jgi:hypothetical protein